MSGKCPNCEREVATAKLDAMELAGGRVRMKAFSVSCPCCYTVMAVLRDPQLEQIPPKLKTLAIRICSGDIDLARILFGEVIPLRRDAR